MFICEKCLENYTNFAISISRGPCEDCGKVGNCVDIPSSQLVFKKQNSKDIPEQKSITEPKA